MQLSKPIRRFFAATALAGAASFTFASETATEDITARSPEHHSVTHIMQDMGIPTKDARELDSKLRSVVFGISQNYVDSKKANFMKVYNDMLEGMSEAFQKNPASTVEEVVEAGFDKALHNLDPHSTYFNAEEFKSFIDRMTGQFAGFGVFIDKASDNAPVEIVDVMDDSTPAAKAGLKAGDKITHIDGKSLIGMTAEDASDLMKGDVGSKAKLTVERAGHSQPLNIVVTRDIIEVNPVTSRVLDNDVGYIRLSSFSGNSDAKVDEAIEKIKQDTGGNVSSYILDLRSNGGGSLNQSAEIVDNFIDQGIIVSSHNSKGIGQAYRAEKGDMIDGKPLVVLVDGYSASASEITAGALQDHGRAKIVGGQTFGKGSVQRIWNLNIFNETAGIKITTALYYTPKGRSIQGHGITPDIRTDFGVAAKVREATLDNTITNPNDATKDTTRSTQSCEVNPTLQAPDISKIGDEYILKMRDGSQKIDYDLLCAVQTLKGNTPYVHILDLPPPVNTMPVGQPQKLNGLNS